MDKNDLMRVWRWIVHGVCEKDGGEVARLMKLIKDVHNVFWVCWVESWSGLIEKKDFRVDWK